MTEIYPQVNEAIAKSQIAAYNPTVGENIDRRIKALQEEIQRLTDLKEKLQSPNGLLFVPIEDLRRAMMY